MSDRITKLLARLSEKERRHIKAILKKILSNDTRLLDVKKLKGRDDVFRVRKGTLRILFQKTKQQTTILAVERRSETTYSGQ